MYNQIYSIVEDFIKAVEQDKNFSFLLKNWNGKRGPKRRLSISEQWEYLRKRNIIESDWGVLKQNYFLEYHQARCMDGLFRHYVSCISAYILECRLKSYPKIKTRI